LSGQSALARRSRIPEKVAKKLALGEEGTTLTNSFMTLTNSFEDKLHVSKW
jgi:hypothetical protein